VFGWSGGKLDANPPTSPAISNSLAGSRDPAQSADDVAEEVTGRTFSGKMG